MLTLSPDPKLDSSSVPSAHSWLWRGYSVHYVKAGLPQPQRPPLLLVHGFGASTDHWKKNIPVLQQDFEVWAIDLLGFGRSQKPATTYGGELWRDQLHDFIETQIGRPTILVGNSLGGYAALCVAAQESQSVAGVVLVNSAGPFTATEPEPEPSPMQKLLRNLRNSLLRQPWVAFLIFLNMRRPATVRKTLQKVYLDPHAVTDELVQDILRPACDRGAFQVFASVFKSGGKGAKVDELLHQMTCPLLVLWGEADPWIKVSDRSVKFRQHYPSLKEHFLKAGHCPHDEVPDRVNELIREWVLAGLSL